jgi:2-polyprenyl-3-methyl-5-hydroxy-6-metoxy-1,4-benzoquinol methylase
VKQIDTSPINNNELKPYITCKDYTVSRETFSIFIDEKSELLVTTPRPEDNQLGKYYESEDYISHSNTNKTFIDKIYQRVRNYTIKKKVKLINSFNLENKTILDIGSGTGDFLLACKKNGWQVAGVEPNEKAKSIANSKINQKDSNSKIFESIESLQANAQNGEHTKFDVITMWHVLEHVPNLNEYVSSLKRLLKPDGTLIVAVPNYKSFDANHYKEFWAAYDVPRHLWHFSKKSIEGLFDKEKMKVIKALPMKFDSYYVSLLSEKYKNGKSNVFKAFFIGLKSNLTAKSSKEYSSHIYIIKNS